MLNNFRTFQSLFYSHGARWLLFRVGYALWMRTGFVRVQMPAYTWKERPLETWLKKNVPSRPEAYAGWRRQNSPKFFFEQVVLPGEVPWNPQLAVDEADRILNGEIKYFSHQLLKTGCPPDWHKDPVSGIQLDPRRHWSELPHNGEADIKFVWEANRFSMAYTLVRAYASARDERFAAVFWRLVQSWAESNPPHRGSNWMDGQEVALRLIAWTFGYYTFMDCPSATDERIAQFTVLVAAQAERIYRNIAYAISTHSNHTISEGFGLWLVGLLFPELKDSADYLKLGRELLEREASAQIFPDGSYSMYSLNYHRFVLQIYFCALRLGELNHSPLSESVYRVVKSSVDYLSQLIEPSTGQMPNYGSNDGALVLPINNCDFTDYRPLLQLGSYLFRRELLFERGPWDEDILWLCGTQALTRAERSDRSRSDASRNQISFPHGGTYILHGSQSKAVIRCTDHRARPSQADQLHVDLWWRGQNIACDAGTYVYSGQGIWRNGLARTAVHNTVTVDSRDQMKRVSRFTWTNWSHGKVLKQDEKLWQGEHDGYRHLPDPVNHRRTVISLQEDRWLVVDHLTAAQFHHYALHWLLSDGEYGVQDAPEGSAPACYRISLDVLDSGALAPSDSKVLIQMGLLEGSGDFSIVRGDPNSTRGWRSQYYGHKEPAISAMLETNQPRACFWTFFGLESDLLELREETLKIGSHDWETSINLQSPISHY